MPRAAWKGFLRLSLVSCPVALVPATTKTKSVRLHQVWVPEPEPGPEPPRRRPMAFEPDEERPLHEWRGRPPPDDTPPPSCRETWSDAATAHGRGPPAAPMQPAPASRIALQPVARDSGRAIEREAVRKGYEYEPGRYVTFTPAELKALDVESSRTLDLTSFVPRAEIDPIYFDQPYYLYPDGAVAAEAFEVIAAAMAQSGMAGLGRIAMSRRERLVMVEPRGAGMVTITLRAAAEIRAAEFPPLPAKLDPDMVATAEAIIARRTGHFDPSTFRDRYQEALRELIEAKLKGRRIVAKPLPPQPPVVDLMAALKRSLAQETAAPPARRRRATSGDRRQANMLLPIGGERPETAGATAALAPRRRHRG